MHPRLDAIDRRISQFMHAFGHAAHRFALGALFCWFGLLKPFGYATTTSLLAHTVYWGSPELVVPILGWWEFAIGVCMIVRPLVRVALLLLAIRLPGTLLALVLLPEVCFDGTVLVPTPEGQYLVKDLALFTAAMVIGGTVRREQPPRVYH